MLRRNSWARGHRKEYTHIWDFGFDFCYFPAHCVFTNYTIQQTPAHWGALKPLTETNLTRLGGKENRAGDQRSAYRQRMSVGEFQKVRVWERVKPGK